MGLVVRCWCSWILFLVCGPGFGSTGDEALVRHERQADWWRHYERAVPAHSSFGWGSRNLPFGSNTHNNVVGARWGSLGGRVGGMPRQLPPTVSSLANSPVSIQCEEDTMVVDVQLDFFGTGKIIKPSDLSLGPQGCQPNGQTDSMATFQISLQGCGNRVQRCTLLSCLFLTSIKIHAAVTMNPDWVIYSTSLTYNPTSSLPIIRTNAAVVPITCYYYRHSNVSSSAIKPTWVPFSSTVSSQERLSFSLGLMTADWSGPSSSSVFRLGDVLYIEASVDSLNHIDMILYVDRCVATSYPDPTSTPSYDIITDNGCLVDGTQDDVSSAFQAPRVQPEKLRFTVDVFRFLDTDASLVYITCYLRGVASTQVPDSMNKACSYNKVSQSWSAVEGPSNVCQCCGTPGSCTNPTGMAFGGRSRPGRPRGFGKREALNMPLPTEHLEEQMLTTLGPLLVIGPKQANIAASVTKEESAPMELWVMVAIGCVSLLIILVALVFIVKYLRKPQYVSGDQ